MKSNEVKPITSEKYNEMFDTESSREQFTPEEIAAINIYRIVACDYLVKMGVSEEAINLLAEVSLSLTDQIAMVDREKYMFGASEDLARFQSVLYSNGLRECMKQAFENEVGIDESSE